MSISAGSDDLKGMKEDFTTTGALPVEDNDFLHELPGLGVVSAVYEAKVHVINAAIAELGMGRYQWHLYILAGFGWFVDNVFIKCVLIAVPQMGKEFHVVHASFLQLALTVGFTVGAIFWGVGADVIGRRYAFYSTIFIASVFGLAVGGAPNFVAAASLLACVGVGAGGGLPIDGALFVEFVPGASQGLLVLLTSSWSFAQLFASLLAWEFVGKMSCATAAKCPRSSNMGWRYLFFTVAAVTSLMFISRYFLFTLYESPKYLLGRGRDEDAVKVIHAIAKYNNMDSSLTLQDIKDAGDKARAEHPDAKDIDPDAATPHFTSLHLATQSLSKLGPANVKKLFASRKMAIQTTFTLITWFLVGFAYPLYNAFLPFFLARNHASGATSVYLTYRNLAIISCAPLVGSVFAYFATKQKHIGMQRVMAFAAALTGVFLCLTTTAKNQHAVLGWSFATGLTQNAMYSVLYAYTPIIFPAPVRGTGVGLSSMVNRVAALGPPFIIAYSSLTSVVPLWVAAGTFLTVSLVMLVLPIEPMGHTSI